MVSTSFGFETTASKGEWTGHFNYSILGPARVLSIQGHKVLERGGEIHIPRGHAYMYVQIS